MASEGFNDLGSHSGADDSRQFNRYYDPASGDDASASREYDLPGLQSVRITVQDSNVHIGERSSDSTHPQLVLDTGGLRHTYDARSGLLNVWQVSPSEVPTSSEQRPATVHTFGSIVGRNVQIEPGIIVDGVPLIPSTGHNVPYHPDSPIGRASLLLPPKYQGFELEVGTEGGDVEVCDVSPKQLRVETGIGAVSLENAAVAGSAYARTLGGSVHVEHLTAGGIVQIRTGDSGDNVGNIWARRSNAAAWVLATDTGEISARRITGAVSHQTNSGHIDIPGQTEAQTDVR